MDPILKYSICLFLKINLFSIFFFFNPLYKNIILKKLQSHKLLCYLRTQLRTNLSHKNGRSLFGVHSKG